ncbi:MAG TPA: hypothetical protein VF546_13970 [Pyrinomonadaceae bacterium]|jgi:hypothetical protein
MGGFGSTRWGGQPARVTVEGCYSISALLAPGLVAPRPGCAGVWFWPRGGFAVSYRVARSGADLWLALKYEHGRALAQRVRLDATRPHYGGLRWFFRCPLCWRRVRDLHLPAARLTVFGCRRCHALAYESAQVTRGANAFWRHCTRTARALGVTRGAARRLVRSRCGGYVHEAQRLGAGVELLGAW